jgi:hypothetical protein
MNTEFWYVMVFYALLSCFLMPFVMQYALGSDSGLEKGYIAGTVVSMVLWFTYGKKYANM